ncbi:T-lymphoma invasion and metastasis-inducing protein 2 [Bagarius yarrelli]|uniref:T-lymphoma invasion and metastasis-inducing protein 2 n=1 Tax=Bagarius yarrelli TaxID=175774 RepID=A0A556UYF5_BAGYA|nr:T-lymphoma invasion and metastasis-inducing protein 2 [Bagarius yarrelli]
MSPNVFLEAMLYTAWKLHIFQCWLQGLWSSNGSAADVDDMLESLCVCADGRVVLHTFSAFLTPDAFCSCLKFQLQDFPTATSQGDVVMSRRKVSVKELGEVDFHGWLYKKTESQAFLRAKWRKYWVVLKECSLYWYKNVSALKAEGYVNLRGFTLDQAQECRRKFAIKASHPQIVTLFFAAENLQDMYKWLKCYSEDSEDDEETGAQYTEQLNTSFINGCPLPRSSSSPCRDMLPLVSPVCNTSECVSSDSESWLELSTDSQGPLCDSEHSDIGRLQDYQGKEGPPSDELEMLYLHLKHANLSPCGELQPVTKRDFRSSFIRRCKNETMNEKLHLVRALNSTLKIIMGNTDSQPSNLTIPGKSRPCSLKLHSAKEEVLSPHSWWRNTGGASASKIRGSSRKKTQPYVSYHYDYIDTQHPGSAQGKEWNHGSLLAHRNCRYSHTSVRSLNPEAPQKKSPKVLLSGDGSLRVEFTNGRRGLDSEHCSAPMDSTLRDSKGSSISSEESWYDSPWGAATELCDNVFTGNQPSDDSSGYTTLSSTRTEDIRCPSSTMECSADELLCPTEEDSGIGDSVLLHIEQKDIALNSFNNCYVNPNLTGPFPTIGIFPEDQIQNLPDSTTKEASQENKPFTSLTLPCRKSAGGDVNSRKDSLKSRIRRISDWTGSLSRKKRRMQEPSETFSIGDGLVGDSNVQLVVDPCWNLLNSQTRSACSLTEPYTQQNQNVYENFMQELEIGDVFQECEEVEGEQAESSSGSLSSLEQMELMFEKEQGVVRRAGRLAFKPLLSLHKERKLELVARRRWRQYWVTLKGCMLLLSEADGKSCPEQEMSPRYVLLAEDSIVQAVPEHPKRENVFCLSNAYGEVYLFQASNQTDVENWVTAIHSASASHLAKRQGKEDTLRLLRSQSRTLLQKIDMDSKMKKMAELQLSVITDLKNRKAVEGQIQQWEQNLEKFNMELFRMRCYLASLQGSEQPNPKNLLAVASRQSKISLGRLGIFSVSSFHALICTRDETGLRRHCRSQPRASRTKRGIFSSQKGLDSLTRRKLENRQSLSQQRLDVFPKLHPLVPPEGKVWNCSIESLLCVCMPDRQLLSVPVRHDFLVADVLVSACKLKQLDPALYYLRVKRHSGPDVETPAKSDLLRDLVYDELEVCHLNTFTLTLSRPADTRDFGFAVTGHVDGSGRSHIYVSEVNPEGLAFTEVGLKAGDEILVLNSANVSNLDLGLIHTLFNEQTLRLVLRREESMSEEQGRAWPGYDPSGPFEPVPPSSASYCHLLPSHNTHTSFSSPDGAQILDISEDAMVPLPGGVCHKAKQCRKNVERTRPPYRTFPEDENLNMEGYRNPYSTENSAARGSPRHMTATERLCKVIQELLDTEKSYVKDLGCLFEIYLKPLEQETFLSSGEMESLFGSLPEMLDFQRVFLQTLEEKTSSAPELMPLQTPEQLKKLLSSLGGSFLYYADHFKLYSGFCANHIKVQKVLERAKTDRAFKEFLEERNPTKQHSSTLESYLIKPVQRVLKYPLLLRELVSLTDPESEEHCHLLDALRAMEKVASHINEMQKIYEDYGTVFDQLVAEQCSTKKEVTEISMGEFIIHGSALWLNPMASLGRMKKEPELTIFIFKRAVILVHRESIKLKKRMTSSRSGDLDPFKFRWLVPATSLHFRPGNSAGSENPCLWELVHTKSEVEGRPETVFQLCSRSLESKLDMVKAIRCVLKENPKRSAPAERGFRDNLTFPRRNHQATARSRSWTKTLKPDESHLLGGDTHSEPDKNARPPLGSGTRLGSLTSSLEAQLQRLSFLEEVPPEARIQNSGHMTVIENSSLLVRDYSVQSLNSVVTEGSFFDTVMGVQKAAIPTL